MKKLLLLISLTILSSTTYLLMAQSLQQSGNELSRIVALHQRFDFSYNLFSRSTPNQEAARYVRNASYLHLNDSELTRLLTHRPQALLLQIPDMAGGTQSLRLVQHFPAESDAVVRVFDRQGSYTTSLAPSVHYRGIIEGDNQSLVALSINENNVTAVISNASGNVVLAKLNNKSSGSHEWILYLDNNLQLPRVFSCGQDDLPELPASHPNLNTGERSTKCVKVHFVCDYALYQQFGSVSAVSNYVTNLYNAVATLYQNETIPTQISQIDVYTSSDPYTSYSSTCDILTPFGNNMSSSGINGSLAHFLSGRSLGGGCAWRDVLCYTTSYQVAASGIDGAFSPVPTFSWDVEVITHEMGHNLGSPHTHACAWNGNNTAIDGCGPTAGYSEGTCATAALPTNGGTIMSYCHLLSTGINFSNGFGTQPGNLVRSEVDNAACLTTCCTPPVAAITPSNVTITAGQSTTLTASGGGSYLWSNGSTAAMISVAPLVTTSYYVTVTNASGCTASAAATVTVPCTAPTVTITPALANVIQGQSISLTASGGTSYVWNTGSTSASISVTPATTTTYTVTVTAASGCTATASRIVTVSYGCPSLQTVCFDTNYTFAAATSQSSVGTIGCLGTTSNPKWLYLPISNSGSATFSVSDLATAIDIDFAVFGPFSNFAAAQNACPTLPAALACDYSTSSGGSFAINNAVAGQGYILLVTNYSNIAATLTLQETTGNIVATPLAAISPANSSINAGESSTFVASGGTSYLWSNGSTTASLTVSPSVTTTYTVTVSNAGACTATASHTVSVTQACLDLQQVCLNGSYSFNAPFNQNGIGAVACLQTTANPTWLYVPISTSGDFSASITSNSIDSDIDFAVFGPYSSFAAAQNSCGNLPTAIACDYSVNSGGSFSIPNAQAGQGYLLLVTEYFNSANNLVTIQQTGGTASSAVVASVSPSVSDILSGQTASLTASGGSSYLWSNGATTSNIVVAPTTNSTAIYTYTVTVSTANACSATASATVNVTSPCLLPSPWQHQDIGNPAIAGSVCYDTPTGTFTIDASGTDIGGTADKFHYVYQALNQNGRITAKVVSVENTNAAAKAGVMIRETLTGGSKNTFVGLTPTTTNKAFVNRRTTTSGTTTQSLATAAPPYWVRLVRNGTGFKGYISTNGATWTLVKQFTATMNANCFVGLAVTAKNNTTLNTSVFRNVSIEYGNFKTEEGEGDAPLSNTMISDIVVAPNPNNGQFEVSFFSQTSAATQVRLIDVAGRIVFQQDDEGQAGYHELSISQSLPVGLYFLQIESEGELQTEKVVIEH